jgi:hypothetical protein
MAQRYACAGNTFAQQHLGKERRVNHQGEARGRFNNSGHIEQFFDRGFLF